MDRAYAHAPHGLVDIGASEIIGIEMFQKTATPAETGALVGLVLRGTFDVARGDGIRTFTSA